jgi:hypothetical protein
MERFLRYKLDHILFWVATVSFHMFTRADMIGDAGVGPYLSEIVVRNALLAILIYGNLLFLIPRLARRDRWLIYLGGLVLLLACYSFLKTAHDEYLFQFTAGAETSDPGDRIFYNLSIGLFYLAFSTALQLSREWLQQREVIRKIEIEKLNTELDYLKAQINPHMFFNSINTIYFLIDKENAAARDTLSAFAEMLRYQLYECTADRVPAEKELLYMQRFVDLQRLRLSNHKVEFTHTPLTGVEVAPLLFIPFVENAFKFVSHTAAENVITLDLHTDGERLVFSAYNTCEPSAETTGKEGNGIGLVNVRRRLQLLYPNRHRLVIDEQPGSYRVHLELDLRPA